MAHAKYMENRKWAAGHDAEVERIIRFMAGSIVHIGLANASDDLSMATDYTISVDCGSIGGRIRRPGYWEKYHDVTFRYQVLSGVDTEYAKIMKGTPRWYLYAWMGCDEKLKAWIFIDMDVLRKSGLLECPKRVLYNRDGFSTFIAVDIEALYDIGAIMGCDNEVVEYLKSVGSWKGTKAENQES